MNQQIICRHCNAPNTPGSKFCNHCGNRLTPSTNYICPNCQTPNPKNRFYCDNCGTRLVQDKIPPLEKPKPDAEEATSKIFSLPARKPGETGELDPSTIPDWLRTGKTGKTPGIPDEMLDGDMPRIEDLKPNKGDTGDLPDWLTGTDSDPVFEPPAAITTEHYLELIKGGKTDEDFGIDLFDEDMPGASASEAELPDWLSGLEQPDVEEEIESDEEAIIPDWLPDFQQPTESATKPPPPVADSTAAADEWDWLADEAEDETAVTLPQANRSFDFDDSDFDLDDLASEPSESPPAETSATYDWLDNLDDDEDLSDFLDAAPVEPAADEEMFPDWLTDQADQPDIAADETAVVSSGGDNLLDADDEFPDWLADDEDADDETDADDGFIYKEMTGWLTALDDDDKPAAAEPDTAAEFDLLATNEDLEEWLIEEESAPKPTEPEDDLFGDLDDWLTDEDDVTTAESPVVETAASSDTFDWIDEAGEEETVTETAVADGLDWLDEPETTTTDDLFTSDLPDSWTDELDELVETESTDEESLDWLAELGLPETSSFDKPDTGILETLESIGDGQIDADLLQDATLKELSDSSVPDWLSNDAPDRKLPDSDKLDLALTGILDGENLDDTGLDWLTSPLDDDQQEEPIEEAEPEEPKFVEEVADLEEEPDWLTAFLTGDLPSKATGDAVPADMLASDRDDLPDIDDLAAEFEFEFEESAEDHDDTLLEPDGLDKLGNILPEREPIKLDSDVVFADSMIGDSTDNDWITGEETEGELPDWLTELGSATAEAKPQESPRSAPASDDMPDWIADLRPGEQHDTGALPEMMSSPRLPDEVFEDLPDQFAGEALSDADLPDWLHDAVQDDGADLTETAVALGSVARHQDTYDDFLESSDGLEDLEHVLSDLPPVDPLAQRLPKAEIPDWVENLKPPELTSGEPVSAPSSEPEESGPLVGIGGTIAVQAAAVPAYKLGHIAQFTVTKEQQQQVALLRQLTQSERKLSSDIEHTHESTSLGLRLVVAGLIIMAILVGLFGPLLIAPQNAAIPPQVAALETAVTAAAGQPVLVAFEYTPAMAGELAIPTEILLSQLQANGSPILVVSQYAAGVALAEDYVDGQNGGSLGFVPGEAVGLRLLANCLGVQANCQSFMSRPVTGELRETLRNVALVIVVTGERDSLVNWIEQVGVTLNVPIVAAVTEAMAPIAAPYYASGQLSGVLAGGLETAVYQAQWPQNIDEPAYLRQLNAQTLALLTAALILIVGGLLFSIKRDPAQKKKA